MTNYTIPPQGYLIKQAQIPMNLIENASRIIQQNIFTRGFVPDEIKNFRESACWFPWLRGYKEIIALRDFLPDSWRTGISCEPQILLQPPDTPTDEPITIETHVDEPPSWANNRNYLRIVGIPLTESHPLNGGLHIQSFGTKNLIPVSLMPGDAICLHPDLPHASGYNITGETRIAVYFRFLEDDLTNRESSV